MMSIGVFDFRVSGALPTNPREYFRQEKGQDS